MFLIFVIANFTLCPSHTVHNLLPNEDECIFFEIHTHSSLLKGQINIFSVGHGSF